MTAEPGRRCAVLGSPIAHSLSPALHRAAYAGLGLSGWTYDSFAVDAPGLAGFVEGLDASWRGLSLTMPLKVAVLGLGEVDPLARLAEAGNTLILDAGHRRVYNTDVAGLVWAVREVVAGPVETVTVLGAGATARSALVSASRLGARRVQLLARTPARAAALRDLAEELGVELVVLPWSATPPAADLLVSTVTAGAAGARSDELVADAAVVFDAVYDPWPTPLAQAAQRADRPLVSGLDLLVGQALGQVELMTGRRPTPDVLRAAGLAALASRRRADDRQDVPGAPRTA